MTGGHSAADPHTTGPDDLTAAGPDPTARKSVRSYSMVKVALVPTPSQS